MTKYCFVEEDLANLREDDQLVVQAAYAKRLGLYYCCNLREKTIVDCNGRKVDLCREHVVLRASCSSASIAMEILEKQGAILLETPQEMDAIEHWDRLPLSRRKILSIQVKHLLRAAFPPEVQEFISKKEELFIKTRRKGFSAKINAQQLFASDAKLLDCCKKFCANQNDEIMISELYGIRSDSLGNKESRHFVVDGKIVNSSRQLKSIRHAVPQNLLTHAEEIVKSISQVQGFPKNYVIDICEFERGGRSFVDVVEMNPVTTSLCYVNNSVFFEMVPEVVSIRNKLRMGVEFCFDAITHPERYLQKRHSGVSYAYYSETQYDFR